MVARPDARERREMKLDQNGLAGSEMEVLTEIAPRNGKPAMKKQGITRGVAQPREEGGCWAQVYVYAGDAWSPLAVCGNSARKGFLTCFKHQDRQAAAQELQARAPSGDLGA